MLSTRTESGMAAETRISAALGAVTVQDVGLESPGEAIYGTAHRQIAEPRLPAHGNELNSEPELRLYAAQPQKREAVGRACVRHDADGMAAPRLLAGEIQHVPEQPAHGRAHDVQDPQRPR